MEGKVAQKKLARTQNREVNLCEKMPTLTDECLLYVFGFLNPIEWVTIAQVCKKWKGLAQTKFEKLTEINIKNPQICTKKGFKYLNLAPIDKKQLYSVLRYAGPYVQSLTLVNHGYKQIIFGDEYGFCIQNIDETNELISMLARTCKSLVELRIGNKCASLEELFKSSTNLKRLILPPENLERFSQLPFDSVEEVIWEVSVSNVNNLNWFFPNVKKLTLYMNAKLFNSEWILNNVLKFAKKLTSLSVLINTVPNSTYYLSSLLDIAALSQLEELRFSMGKYAKAPNSVLEFYDDSVKKLISSCQNLRIVEFGDIDIGKADVQDFFSLPKLEELAVVAKWGKFNPARSSKNVEHLSRLVISFEKDEDYYPPCLCDAITKMPVLTHLEIDGVDEDETVDLTHKAIDMALANGKNVAIRPSRGGVPRKIVKTGKSECQAETLKLWIEPQRSDHFVRINKKKLEDCTIVDEKFEIFQRGKTLLEQYSETYKCCPQEPVIGIEEDESEESDDDVSDHDNEHAHNFSDDSDLSDEEDASDMSERALFVRQLAAFMDRPQNDEDSDEDSDANSDADSDADSDATSDADSDADSDEDAPFDGRPPCTIS